MSPPDGALPQQDANAAIRLYEGKFRDAITHMLTVATRPGRPVETAVAEALRKMFLAAPVHVIWRTRRSSTAATCPDMRGPGRALSDPRRIEELINLAEPMRTSVENPLINVTLSGPEAAAWGMLLIGQQEQAQLWIIVEGPRNPISAGTIAWFSPNAQGQRELYTVVQSLMALKAVRRDATYAELARRGQAVVSGADRNHQRDLEEAIAVVDAIGRDSEPMEARRVSLAQDLAAWAAQGVLGIGRSSLASSADSGEASRLEGLCEALEHVAARARAEGVGRPEELQCLSGILRATLPETAPIDLGDRTLPDAVDPALRLLVTWTAVHELARRVADRRRSGTSEEELSWEAAVSRGLPDLARLLEQRSIAVQSEATFVKNWARLWFCLVLLRSSSEGGGWWKNALLDDDKWRFRADLSYVLRESVRFIVYGGREDYRFQPSAFADALRTLVEQHVLRVVGLSREHDVRSLLREIGEVRGNEGYHFAAGHLQHILEIYIGGHFLLSLTVEAPEGLQQDDRRLHGWSVAEVLASRSGWRPGGQTTTELLQSFSLAALFHDVGMLLFSRYNRPSEALCRGDPRLESCLSDVEASFRRAGSNLIERCVEDLRGADYLDTTADPGLARWLEDQLHSGAPDHALLGAWYLHRVSRAAPSTPAEVVREALRAVLLHSLPALSVDVERDPVAGLLVLCDEVFEWEPFTRPGPVLTAPGRSLNAMAADLRPRRSRTRNLFLPGLRLGVEPDGGIRGRLALRPEDYERGWPRFELRLQSPERLEQPVHLIWLSMAQNLGRVERSRHGWGASVKVSSLVPARLRSIGRDTRWLVSQIARYSRSPARVSLERWLFDGEPFPPDPHAGQEDVLLEARNTVLHTEDIRRAFPALEEDAERILSEFERKIRTGPF